nr:DUF222 domain-containing protein [Microbacterium saccharophilum]
MDALLEAVTAARAVWPVGRVEGTEGARLIAVNDALGTARPLLEAASTQVAAEIARQSRPELGADSLAKANGFRTATALLASTLGTTNGEASRLVQVGDATAPRVLLSGGEAPAKHPHVGAALAAGAIGALAASAIVSMLDRVALRGNPGDLEAAERTLAGQAPGLTLDQLAKLIARAEAHLDPDGVPPREEELRGQRFLRVQEDRSGMLHLTGGFDPEHGAAIMVAIDAIVGAELGAQRDADASSDVDAPRRSVAMMRADALVKICEHLLGCAHRDTPLRGATVVVRMTLEDLRAGTGHATIDGLAAPVSIATARRMAESSRRSWAGTARSWTGAGSGACSRGRRDSRSPNATAAARCAASHPGTQRSTTSGGGRETAAPPTWTTASCSASPVTTASTTTGGTSASTGRVSAPGCGSSHPRTSTRSRPHAWADADATTTSPPEPPEPAEPPRCAARGRPDDT